MRKKKKLLLIEDKEDLCALLKFNIECSGRYEVIIAMDGEDGLKKAKEAKPHLIILDLGLPKLSGEEVCKKVRSDENIGKTPIIMATAKGSEADRIIGKVIGADSYISKPFEIEELLNEIDKLLEK